MVSSSIGAGNVSCLTNSPCWTFSIWMKGAKGWWTSKTCESSLNSSREGWGLGWRQHAHFHIAFLGSAMSPGGSAAAVVLQGDWNWWQSWSGGKSTKNSVVTSKVFGYGGVFSNQGILTNPKPLCILQKRNLGFYERGARWIFLLKGYSCILQGYLKMKHNILK